MGWDIPFLSMLNVRSDTSLVDRVVFVCAVYHAGLSEARPILMNIDQGAIAVGRSFEVFLCF